MKSNLTYGQLCPPIIASIYHAARVFVQHLPDPTAETIGQGLAADPSAISGAADISFPMRIDVVKDAQRQRLIAAIESVMHFITSGVSLVRRRLPEEKNSLHISGNTSMVTITDRGESQVLHDVYVNTPSSVLNLVALTSSFEVIERLRRSANYVLRKNPENAVAALLVRYAAGLAEHVDPTHWFMDADLHSTIFKELHAIADDKERAARDVRELANKVLNNPGNRLLFTVSETKRVTKIAALDPTITGSLISLWVTMTVCEPLAFLLAFLTLHAPLSSQSNYMARDIREAVVEDDESMDPVSYCMLFDNNTGGPCEAEEESV